MGPALSSSETNYTIRAADEEAGWRCGIQPETGWMREKEIAQRVDHKPLYEETGENCTGTSF